MMNDTQIETMFTESLIRWYSFKNNSTILFLKGGFDEFQNISFDGTDSIHITEIKKIDKKYDYIICPGIIEKSKDPVTLVSKLNDILVDDGILLLICGNRFSLNQLCGEKDYFTKLVFDGIDSYQRYGSNAIEKFGGKLYSKSEIEELLKNTGWSNYSILGVYPSIFRPQVLYGKDYIPNENLDERISPHYSSNKTVFLEQAKIIQTVADNNLLLTLANGFFIEVSKKDGLYSNNINQVTLSSERGKEKSLATIISKEAGVIKKALYPEGKNRINLLNENTEYLMNRGIPMVESKMDGDSFVMPFIDCKTAIDFFRKLIISDETKFYEKMDEFYRYILKSSDATDYDEIQWDKFEPGWEKRKKDDPNRDKWEKMANGSSEEKDEIGVILKKGFVDLIALNCFYYNENFYFFDQEEYVHNFPAKAILLRTIDVIYGMQPILNDYLCIDEVMKHYGLYNNQKTWRNYSTEFLNSLRNDEKLAEYRYVHGGDSIITRDNRFRMNFSSDEYNKYFANILKNTAGNKLYIFGSGKYCERFLEKYQEVLNIDGIVDNNEKKWGTFVRGVLVDSPKILEKCADECKVFICISDFQNVLSQLLEMKIENISIFTPAVNEAVPRLSKEDKSLPKKYEVGYIAGVFDLFHVGHVNLLRRAKEQCEYLIVGVVTDEQVVEEKRTQPYYCFEDRRTIVQSCEYVDEAVEIPFGKPGSDYALERYHFDVQFSGSDYENDPNWLAAKAYLKQHGADLIFFSYTESVSTTKIKEKIRK